MSLLIILLALYLIYRWWKKRHDAHSVDSRSLASDGGVISSVRFNDGYLYPYKKNRNGAILFENKYCKPSRIVIDFSTQGINVKQGPKKYYLPFDSSLKYRIIKNFEPVYTPVSSDGIRTLNEFLNNEYYYSYYLEGESISTGYDKDTRHYTKSGELDKRYSQQNKHQGGKMTTVYRNYTYGYYVLRGYIISLYHGDNVISLMIDSDLNGVYDFLKNLLSDNMEVLPVEEILYERSKPSRIIPVLNQEDRDRIKEWLAKYGTFDSNVDYFTKHKRSSGASNLFEGILLKREKELLG